MSHPWFGIIGGWEKGNEQLCDMMWIAWVSYHPEILKSKKLLFTHKCIHIHMDELFNWWFTRCWFHTVLTWGKIPNFKKLKPPTSLDSVLICQPSLPFFLQAAHFRMLLVTDASPDVALHAAIFTRTWCTFEFVTCLRGGEGEGGGWKLWNSHSFPSNPCENECLLLFVCVGIGKCRFECTIYVCL